MNLSKTIGDLGEFLKVLGSEIGSRLAGGDGFAIACLVSLISLFILLLLLNKRRSPDVYDGNIDRLGGLLGRLEKLEMTVHESRTTMMRTLELLKGDVGFLKQELTDVRALLKLPSSGSSGAGGSGSGTGGSTPSGGGGGPFSKGGGGRLVDSYSITDTQEIRAAAADLTEEAIEEIEIGDGDLSACLKKTRRSLFERIKGVFSQRAKIDETTLEELEAMLVSSDLGVRVARGLIDGLRQEMRQGSELSQTALVAALKLRVLSILDKDAPLEPGIRPINSKGGPLVVMVVGVNGVGKTTTVAKLGYQWKQSGAKVLMVAADTFRAAAADQLMEWGKRTEVAVVSGASESKPSTVVFDGLQRAKSEGVDVVIIDTAGRLHTKSNLMQELQGIKSIMKRFDVNAPQEVLLIVDGTTGQNAVAQAREFNSAVPLTGIIVTKLDGTPKGGIVVAIKDELGVPLRYIGVGEKVTDLRPFVARDFVEALFDVRDPAVGSVPAAGVHSNGSAGPSSLKQASDSTPIQ